MDIPLNAEVYCQEEICGRTTSVIVEPKTRRVTHVVVKTSTNPHIERLVPVEWIAESNQQTIHLGCSSAELAQCPNFIKTCYEKRLVPYILDYSAGEVLWPSYALSERTVPVERQQIPQGELAVRRGARVEAVDGGLGRVDDFVIDPHSESITYLVVREGHWWRHFDMAVPVSQISRLSSNAVYLNVAKRSTPQKRTKDG
jgi:sporulation protein YlmC with PRC-barrel domain